MFQPKGADSGGTVSGASPLQTDIPNLRYRRSTSLSDIYIKDTQVPKYATEANVLDSWKHFNRGVTKGPPKQQHLTDKYNRIDALGGDCDGNEPLPTNKKQHKLEAERHTGLEDDSTIDITGMDIKYDNTKEVHDQLCQISHSSPTYENIRAAELAGKFETHDASRSGTLPPPLPPRNVNQRTVVRGSDSTEKGILNDSVRPDIGKRAVIEDGYPSLEKSHSPPRPPLPPRTVARVIVIPSQTDILKARTTATHNDTADHGLSQMVDAHEAKIATSDYNDESGGDNDDDCEVRPIELKDAIVATDAWALHISRIHNSKATPGQVYSARPNEDLTRNHTPSPVKYVLSDRTLQEKIEEIMMKKNTVTRHKNDDILRVSKSAEEHSQSTNTSPQQLRYLGSIKPGKTAPRPRKLQIPTVFNT